jgi:hypothetical protein
VLATAAATAELVYVIVPARGPQAYAVHGRITWLVLELIAAGLLWRRGALARGLALIGRRSLLLAAAGTGLLYASASGALYGGSLSPVLTPLGSITGGALLLAAVWFRRALVRRERMWLRLLVPAVAFQVAMTVGSQMQRQLNTGHTTAKVLALQFVVTVAAVAVVAAATFAATWLSRRWQLEWRIAPRSR